MRPAQAKTFRKIKPRKKQDQQVLDPGSINMNVYSRKL